MTKINKFLYSVFYNYSFLIGKIANLFNSSCDYINLGKILSIFFLKKKKKILSIQAIVTCIVNNFFYKRFMHLEKRIKVILYNLICQLEFIKFVLKLFFLFTY
jgi:hypothetical protein